MSITEIIDVLCAARNGADIEQSLRNETPVKWIPVAARCLIANKWDFTVFNYRIKPDEQN